MAELVKHDDKSFNHPFNPKSQSSKSNHTLTYLTLMMHKTVYYKEKHVKRMEEDCPCTLIKY